MKEKIAALHCKKHIKIYKLKQLGLSNKEIAEVLGTNTGHVRNALIDYEKKPEKVVVADSVEV